MSTLVQNTVLLLGRVLLSLIFVMSGFGKIFSFSSTTGYMQAQGMPLAWFFLIGAIVFELAGGLSVMVGCWTRLGAALLLIFLVPATLIFHAFWTLPEAEQQVQMIMFMKNLSIFGGLLIVLASGPGRFSIDQRGMRNSAVGY